MKVFRKRRGVSEQKTTLITVALALVAALLLYMIFSGYVPTIMGKAQVTVESVELVKSTEGPCVFTCTVKNTGDKPAKAVSVKLANEQPADFPSVSEASPLEPGRSAAVMLTSGSGLMSDYVGGLTYPLTVHAAFLDNSTYTTALTVTCMGGGKPWTPSQPGGEQYMYFDYMRSEQQGNSPPLRIVKVGTNPFKIVTVSEDYNATEDYNSIYVITWDDNWVYCVAYPNQGGSVYCYLVRLDPDTLEVNASLPIYNENLVNMQFSDDGYMYILTSYLKVYRVDPSTFQTVASLNLYGYGGLFWGGVDLSISGNYLYILARRTSAYWGLLKVKIPDLTLESYINKYGYYYYGVMALNERIYVAFASAGPSVVIREFNENLEEMASLTINGLYYPSFDVISNKLYAGCNYRHQVPDVWRFGIARVDATNFTLEDSRVDQYQSALPNVWTWFALRTDGFFLYCPRWMENSIFIVKIDPETFEQVDKAGPLQP